MRRARPYISYGKVGRRPTQETIVLYPIANDSGWSNPAYTNINEHRLYPTVPTDLTYVSGVMVTDDNKTGKWFFGGLQNGPALIKRIDVCVLWNMNALDIAGPTFVIKGVSTNTSIAATGWSRNIIDGSWRLEDFMSTTPDYTNGPYFSCFQGSGNIKDIQILQVQLFLYGAS